MHLSSWGEIEEGGRATSTSPVRDAFMLADQIALDPYAVDPTPYITEGPTPGDEEEYSQFNRPRRQTTISPSRYAEFGAPLVPQRLRRHGDPENKRCFALGNHPAKFDPADISDPEDPEYSDLDGSRTLVGLHQSYIIDPPPPRKASSSTVSLVRIPLLVPSCSARSSRRPQHTPTLCAGWYIMQSSLFVVRRPPFALADVHTVRHTAPDQHARPPGVTTRSR
jgi:hypothetical protein